MIIMSKMSKLPKMPKIKETLRSVFFYVISAPLILPSSIAAKIENDVFSKPRDAFIRGGEITVNRAQPAAPQSHR